MVNEISPAASRKLAKLKRPYDLMGSLEQLDYTIALRARRRAPERPIRVKAAKPIKAIKPASKGKTNAEIKEVSELGSTPQPVEAESAKTKDQP